MAENKTHKTDESVATFIANIPDEQKRADCKVIASMMRAATGKAPKMWGSSIVGFGDFHYKYDSGREGDAALVGFSPRKQNLTLYMMGGSWNPALLAKLGKHSLGAGCLYIKRLSDVDTRVLGQIIDDAVRQANAEKAKQAEASAKPKPKATKKDAPKVEVRNPNAPGHVARVDAAKYNATKKALLKVLPKKAPGLTQLEMVNAVTPHLPDDLFPDGAYAMWWTKCVQLDLEVKGEVVREKTKPLRWHRA